MVFKYNYCLGSYDYFPHITVLLQKYYEMEARRNLKTAIERSNIGELDIAIQRVQRLRMESEDDLIEAKRKRELLILERGAYAKKS